MRYTKGMLLENEIHDNPFDQFKAWFDEITLIDPDFSNAMILSSVNEDHFPTSRAVLLKEVNEEGFVFYTNFKSNKGQQISKNSHVSLCFLWKELGRQVRICGTASKVSDEKADEYFASRPFESQVGAMLSVQSEVVASRKMLDDRFKELSEKFAGQEIKRPDYWGGFCVIPTSIEFWHSRPNRVNDRILYSRDEWNKDLWKIERLAP